MDNRAEQESRATRALLAFIEQDLGTLPVRVVAGAAMRLSAALACATFGPERGPDAARQALENILNNKI